MFDRIFEKSKFAYKIEKLFLNIFEKNLKVFYLIRRIN